MATPLRVPRQYEGGIVKIRDLGDESVQELLHALRKTPATYNQSTLASAVASMTDTIAASDVEEIVPALLSLYSYRDYSQTEVTDVAQGIARGMEESESERLRLLADDRPSFEERLTRLLSVEPLDVTVRAGVLSLENEHTFREARVVTDIRPVFEPHDPEAALPGAVIVHSLKISYRDDNTLKDFFVALDNDEVRELIEQLERAKAKAENLKSVLKAGGVSYIDAE